MRLADDLRELDRQAKAASIQAGVVTRCEPHRDVLLMADIDAERNACKLCVPLVGAARHQVLDERIRPQAILRLFRAILKSMAERVKRTLLG
jgi:hypothetical protein